MFQVDQAVENQHLFSMLDPCIWMYLEHFCQENMFASGLGQAWHCSQVPQTGLLQEAKVGVRVVAQSSQNVPVEAGHHLGYISEDSRKAW